MLSRGCGELVSQSLGGGFGLLVCEEREHSPEKIPVCDRRRARARTRTGSQAGSQLVATCGDSSRTNRVSGLVGGCLQSFVVMK